jgi:DNA polymerase III delta subunit
MGSGAHESRARPQKPAIEQAPVTASGKSVHLFLGDANVVDPLVHALVDGHMAAASQSLDFEIFRAGERPIGEIEAALRQVGMFTRERAIWLRSFLEPKRRSAAASEEDDAGSEQDDSDSGDSAAELLRLLEGGIPAGTILAISAPTLDARGRLYKWLAKNAAVVDRRVQVDKSGKLSEVALRKAVDARLKELGVTHVGAGVAEEIARRSGNVVGETLQEIDRLVLSQADPTRLAVADVRSGMRDLALGWVFDFTKALEERNLAAAEDLVARLLDEGEPPIRLSALIGSFFGELVSVRPLLDTLPKGAMRMPGPAFLSGPGASLPEAYQGWKWYFRLRAASAFSLPELERLHGRALDLDLSLKSSPASPVLLFSRLLQSACIPGAA